jgi:hypothetical protein
MQLARDDRVRLHRHIAEGLMRGKHPGKQYRKVNWVGRQGTVLRVSKVARSVMVQWDGRASVDLWPPEALEKVGIGDGF